ncbi:MAG: Holliday junction branch migration protein RuvA [Betaproteobacteria bacterium TMED156]|nr:MAG: Holliday junction branch migration protein RuvA [Betaproteobacteria bacterium TMED156]
MIGQIIGKLIKKDPPYILIDVQGIGYEIEVPMSTYFELPEIGGELKLITHFLVREDSHQLFGFLTKKEKITFKHLIKVNGIGSRVALAVLSGMSVDELAQSIKNNEISNIVRLPGIGKKTAERMIIELREKITIDDSIKAEKSKNESDLTNALISLGYSNKEAKRAIKDICPKDNLEENIKAALRYFSK